jgi:hypothetical protein
MESETSKPNVPAWRWTDLRMKFPWQFAGQHSKADPRDHGLNQRTTRS